MDYFGMDIHRKYTVYTHTNEIGQVRGQGRLLNEGAAFEQVLAKTSGREPLWLWKPPSTGTISTTCWRSWPRRCTWPILWRCGPAPRRTSRQLLTTVSGIGYCTALLILSDVGDIKRFPDARHLVSYAGLVPSVHASGDKVRYGRITKAGSCWLRWALVEAPLVRQR